MPVLNLIFIVNNQYFKIISIDIFCCKCSSK